MANVMLREDAAGQLVFYLAKKDLEEIVVKVEHDEVDKWGGELTLGDGSIYYLEPRPGKPSLPTTVRATKRSLSQ